MDMANVIGDRQLFANIAVFVMGAKLGLSTQNGEE
jgi:hypothetical protein